MPETAARSADSTGGDPAYRTRVVLALLRTLRAGQRAQRRRSLAFTVYSSVLLFAVWCGPPLAAAARAGADSGPRGPVAERFLSALPTTLPALVATVVLLTARRALWRGPVAPEQAALSWLLPLPVLRRAVLLPCFGTAVALAVPVTASAGAVAGFLLHTLGAGPLGSATAAGAATGAAVGLTGTSLAALVQRYGDTPSRRGARCWRAARMVTAALWAAAAVSLAHGPWAGERAVMWSGPWGWAALPLLGPAGRVPAVAGWAGVALSALVAVALLCLDGAPAPVSLLSLPTGYLAALQLAEAARLETDDIRRAAQLPWSAGGLALRHGLIPAVGLLTLFAGYAAAAALGGLWTDRLLVLPALVPALVGAALVSAYRGVVPAQLMLGTTTPLGDTGPVMAVLWQLRGPLVALGALAAVDGPARGAEPDAVGLLWPLAVAAGLAWWVTRTARGAVRPGR